MAVLIQKAMIEIPPRFAGLPPVHPDLRNEMATWERAQGLAADVEAYGHWMRDEAERRIGHLYPDATGPNGEKLTPIAWIWARTVESPDPAWKGHVPLVSSWVLRNKSGKPKVWVEPSADIYSQTVSYEIREGTEPGISPTVKRGIGTCMATGAAIPNDYIKAEGRAGRMGAQLMAVLAEGVPRGRVYLRTTPEHSAAADVDCELILGAMPEVALGFRTQAYGMDDWEDLFTPRQLSVLTTFSDLLTDARELVKGHAAAAGMPTDEVRLPDGGRGAAAYADAVVTYLAFNINRCAARWTHLAVLNSVRETIEHLFRLNAIQMNWAYAEANPFSSSTGNWLSMLGQLVKAIEHLPVTASGSEVAQDDARTKVRENPGGVVSTDPPYYDNVPFADLSDFFYVWLRRTLGDVWPDECAYILTPKTDEIIANRYRAGSTEKAAEHFEEGMAGFMAEVARSQRRDVPATIFYAYKATETSDGDVRSTGWDTFLQGVVDAGMQVTATWPLRTEMRGGTRMVGRNALSSSIVLACRLRPEGAALASRSQFVEALRNELPYAVRLLQQGNIAPVDMAQSTIGPGISVFSRYARVIEADGRLMPVSDALAIINEVLGEILDGEEAELDPDTRFAVTWYEQHEFEAADAGDADVLARAKNTALSGIEQAGIGEARTGRFRLYRRDELDPDWDPARDARLAVWEALQHLVATLDRDEFKTAVLKHRLGGYADRAHQLAYLLYEKADHNGWDEEAAAYNNLINTWPYLLPPDDDQGTLL